METATIIAALAVYLLRQITSRHFCVTSGKIVSYHAGILQSSRDGRYFLCPSDKYHPAYLCNSKKI